MLKRASRAPDPDTFFAARFNGLWASIQEIEELNRVSEFEQMWGLNRVIMGIKPSYQNTDEQIVLEDICCELA